MTTSPSLRSHIARTIGRNLLCAALLLAAFLAMRALVGDAVTTMSPSEVPATPIKSTETMDLLADNDCWTDEAPADMQGVIPGHAVVTIDGTTRLGGEQMVSKALDQIFEGADHGITVHGFCR